MATPIKKSATTPRAPGNHRKSPRLNEQPERDLRFDRDEAPVRTGDPRTARQVREEFPPARGREAGLTGASTPDGEPTADDATPETLLDTERSHTPHARSARQPADQSLPIADAGDIGAGRGPDEAELAEVDPVGRREADALARKAREHARDPKAVEPHEAEAQRRPR